jgi:NAD-dependent SIR2 family protein deacetylase
VSSSFASRNPAVAEAPDLGALAAVLEASAPFAVLTGAGCSTESGIPDYRDRDGRWRNRPPISYAAFMESPDARRRYWARSFVGWRRVSSAIPNPGHRALATLEHAGFASRLVTQNVDRLHQKAGSRFVTDLHGRLDRVECTGCRVRFPREAFQNELARRNPDVGPAGKAAPLPDGDSSLSLPDPAGFEVPPCPRCGGILKPAVVFFGEPVPAARVEEAFEIIRAAAALLVVGSSLMVWSGYRFALEASRLGRPIAVVNLGRTRADPFAAAKITAPCGEVLPLLAARLLRP